MQLKMEKLYTVSKKDQELTVAQIAAAGVKSLQSCPTLCYPIPGILQARKLEWGVIAFSSGSDYELLIDKFRLKLRK